MLKGAEPHACGVQRWSTDDIDHNSERCDANPHKSLAQPEADQECFAVDDWAVGEMITLRFCPPTPKTVASGL